MERIVISSDHAGYKLKERLKKVLLRLGFEVLDEGGTSAEVRSDYPDDVGRAAVRVSRGEVSRGISICGTGIGASIAANKFPGVRAALALTPRFARLSREHNDANMLILSGRFMSGFTAERVLKTWLKTPFSQGPNHVRRVKKLGELDKKLLGLLLALCLSASGADAGDYVWQGRSLDGLYRLGTHVVGSRDKVRIVADADRPSAETEGSELFLDFDSDAAKTDMTGRYGVKIWKLTRDDGRTFRDSPTAGFIRSGDRIVLSVPEGSLLAEQTDLESFSISFWVLITARSAPAVILDRIVTKQGRPYGFSVLSSGGRLVFRFDNMFFDASGKPRSVSLQTEKLPDPGRWVHAAFGYDNVSGKMLLTLDGEEADVDWATESGGPESGVLTPRFTGYADLVIGRDTFGYLDDLLVTRARESLASAHSARKSVEQAEFRTPVLTNRWSNAGLVRVAVNRSEHPARATIYARVSQEPFGADEPKPDWRAFSPAETGAFCGRYCQVRVVLAQDHPGVESLDVRTAEMSDLEPPTDVALSVSNTALRVTWRPVEDRRVAGYVVTVREDATGIAVRTDAGMSASCVITMLKDREPYSVTVSSYDGSNPANESLPSAVRGILFKFQEP